MSLINQLQLSKQFNFSLEHFVCFVNQFSLVNPSDIRPLRELITHLLPDLKCILNLNLKMVVVKEMNEAYDKKEQLNRNNHFETSNCYPPLTRISTVETSIQDIPEVKQEAEIADPDPDQDQELEEDLPREEEEEEGNEEVVEEENVGLEWIVHLRNARVLYISSIFV